MSSAHSMTPTSSFCWGLQLHYEGKGFFTRWFESEKLRDKHERSLKDYEVKPVYIQKIDPSSADGTAPIPADMVPRVQHEVACATIVQQRADIDTIRGYLNATKKSCVRIGADLASALAENAQLHAALDAKIDICGDQEITRLRSEVEGWRSQAHRSQSDAERNAAEITALRGQLTAVTKERDRLQMVIKQGVESHVWDATVALERELAAVLAKNVLLLGVIEEVHSWAVCGAITTPEDMMQNLPRIVEITTTKGETP